MNIHYQELVNYPFNLDLAMPSPATSKSKLMVEPKQSLLSKIPVAYQSCRYADVYV